MAARPATRQTRDRTVPTETRAPIRDLTPGGASFRIDWDVRPAFDFIFSLSGDAGETDDIPTADRAWLKEAKAKLPTGAHDSAIRLFESEACIHAAVLIVDRPKVRSAADVVATLEAADPRDVVRAVFADTGDPEVAALIDRAIEGDSSVLPALEESIHDHNKAGRMQLLREPEETVVHMLAVLRVWADLFGPIEARVSSILERDYDARAGDRASLAPVDLIERTTNGIRWLPELRVRRVILAPSYFSRPYNFLMSAGDWRLFGYPVSDESLEAGDPLAAPQSVVRLHRALGDGTRLRILKLLAGQDLYLTEIAQQLELSKPTIKHHLALLRSAGLVTITESGSVVYYSLRRNRLDDASADIKRFLLG